MAVCISPVMSPSFSISIAEAAAMPNSVFHKRFRSSYDSSPSSIFPVQKRYRGTSELILDTDSKGDELGNKDDEEVKESSDSDSESEDAKDEGGDKAVPEGQQRTALVVETTMGQSLRFVPESERPERVSVLRQPPLTTWIDPKDGIAYINVHAYPTPAPPVQTPPSPEWSFGSLPISLAAFIIPLPISSPMISLTVPLPLASSATTEAEGFFAELGAQVEMQRGLIHDHTVQLGELSLSLFERYDRDIRKLFTRSRAVRDEIFFQRYRFRSLEHEHERVVVTFRAIWRPVLALESWAGQTDTQRAALWHAISDKQRENWELRLQLVEERRARLDLAEIVNSMRRGHEPRGGV
uniref:Uncharacterized protein n=1 Tax=Tanacetum cinerariifolium TaxID=118510 RepID=A0A699HSH3_TANCI|nr:hypothetical protein [Tanacetum cinerariifolium]